MTRLGDYDYTFFDEYQAKVLSQRPAIEQLILLDDEVANKIVITRYEGPVDPVEWTSLEQYYSGLFADFITERIEGIIDPTPVEQNRERFHQFRKDIVELNQKLPAQRTARADVLSGPAETVLLKHVRERGFDPSALDITHIGRGSGLYLLELFVTAAQQEAYDDRSLLQPLLKEAAALGSLDQTAARERLRAPLLMVSLWDNQEDGLQQWQENDREGILEMATATGKTVAGIAAIADICGAFPGQSDTSEPDNARILVVAHSNAILKQWEREIQEKLGLPMPAHDPGDKATDVTFTNGRVEFQTAQSLLPRYDRDLADQYDLVIYDEVHHYANESGYGAAIDRPNYTAAIGLSATIGDDQSMKRRQLTELLGDVVYTYGVEQAQRDGIIPDFDWTVHPTPLDPYEQDEWDETTDRISRQFKRLKHADTTTNLLQDLPVPFVQFEDLGDFIRAHEAAGRTLSEDAIPDEWQNLATTIHSRSWIRHRSQPKIDDAVSLAEEYLADPDRPIKLVVFAMDIDTADEIADRLEDTAGDVYLAHSKLESSSRKTRQTVQRNIDAFSKCDNGVLISPKMLDEGIDVPDAEVGINVAGTKTKLQLVQRMGRVLRKHGEQRPHFHHFISMPDENYVPGLDSKEYVQELNWVRELGEMIGVQPIIDDAGVDTDLLERAEQRGHELWAQDLLEDLEIETVQGNVQLEELLNALTFEATTELLTTLDLSGDRVHKDNWQTAMRNLREAETLSIEGLQRVWWLFPLYRERPTELVELLEATRDALKPEENEDTSQRSDSGRNKQEHSNEFTTPNAADSDSTDDSVDHSPDPHPDEPAQAPETDPDDAAEPAEEDSSIVGRIRDSLFGG
ncbi:DEAD/DEAH box helicase family protein [Halorubrum ezzemoulense]|uniref:DEAD/DEAH box helicase family protein n=1 Tax=Halorubrum ezzemoulense TaxID=337243 RepID=A0ABT4Z626_HALEZ|nr:DEAD/DEAH box helicase family protein [Halorubrum ezzemoulense]MDB2246371.1 DEAD/DEAH box helicase family protein [Halorubrum ezzemoulense]MDB2280101.1 DEAD/DEAH box helicase family protein [Halorubrum ezzemoulense]MDB2290498.1 DEAD/DEAH box helicase family protein [Halorubrum ezzemoulense]MDB2293627.1 DEAD/DEAH box helicase family protein [Halorubrum ezzemoulense]MDB2297948.1 DEAD/DEAH box helicase family protein [Halorubrum ezzemoulense]